MLANEVIERRFNIRIKRMKCKGRYIEVGYSNMRYLQIGRVGMLWACAPPQSDIWIT